MVEKAEQVKLMPSIYQRAGQVAVSITETTSPAAMVFKVLKWLELYDLEHEEPAPKTYEAIRGRKLGDLDECTRILADEYDIQEPRLLAIRRIMRDDKGGSDHRYGADWIEQCSFKQDLLSEEHGFWPAAAAWINLQYFERGWTYQEITLSRVAIVTFGSITVRWRSCYKFWTVFFSRRLFVQLRIGVPRSKRLCRQGRTSRGLALPSIRGAAVARARSRADDPPGHRTSTLQVSA